MVRCNFKIRTLLTLVSLAAIILITIFLNRSVTSSAFPTNTSSEIGSLIKKLSENKSAFYIGFKFSVEGKEGWSIPERFTDDSNDVIGQRLLTEISESYFCADEIGQGFTTNVCVPFDNISYVSTP